ncbi:MULTISPECIES: type II secretion system F family protein [Curtobacterium]|jgi:type II secretory pathway component PulF|uniref:type II secretion system F family protein n=1 Tax=Curtobacterium TaxID=2034 RepID=UPI000DA9BF65|nr:MULTISPECIES: type II secretion system F family protein [Curtobacterium]MBB1195436.1 type II secretion system F family protein [Curtobacterium flaccumfaciens]MBF4626689.1 type II secretion system F family protein [Curtobacterium flaccumfaciens]MBO9042920.1 type II secretion system F family protein [Curtobacterium flaccumfaciens pv. flaccumfaciens]MBO9055989.1 type II secretion system F family protein [Curtobacterium flaccumfaciens pv. flaccumfaciens]MBT1664299.1 type II secretion system F f
MSLAFDYRGRDGAGKLVKGRLDAASEGAVVQRLRGMGVSPIAITEAKAGTGLQTEIKIPGFEKGVGLKDLAIMSRQASTMLTSGLSLLRTLTILSDQTENKKLKDILGKVRDDVERGVSFSDAVAKYPVDFPPIMINMIRAGETGGFLDQAMDSIATNFEKEHKLRSTIKSAMTYPVVVLVMSLVAVAIMLIFIVPIFQDMFSSLGGTLPLPTQILVTLSHAMRYVAIPLAIVVVLAWLWWRANKNTERVRAFIDPITLKLPVFGPLQKKIVIARFARNFSNMIGAGVPILQALRIVGEVSNNFVVKRALDNVAEAVRKGESIAVPLAAQSVFPAMVTQMVAVGEDAGSLEIMLEKIAVFYDAEVEATTDALTSLIEPLLIAFLGVVVGGMIIALYMPIFQITNVVQNAS